jgi:hypothetical protein
MHKILAAHGKPDAVLLGWDVGDLLQSNRKIYVIVTQDELVLIDKKTKESIDIPWEVFLNVRPLGNELVIDLKSGNHFTVRAAERMSVEQLILDRVPAAKSPPRTEPTL